MLEKPEEGKPRAPLGLQGAAGARSGGTHCTACFGKGISCSKLELKLQDPLSRSILLNTGTCLQLAMPIADVTPISQGALGSKGHTRVGDQVEICLFFSAWKTFLSQVPGGNCPMLSA